MPSHRAPGRRRSPAVRPLWHLLVPAAVVTGVLVVSLMVMPSWTEVEPSAAEVRSDVPTARTSHTSRGASRGQARTPAPRGIRARRAVSFDSEQARAATRLVERRRLQAERAAAREAARRKAEKLARRRAARLAAMEKTSSFRVGALNILGSQHTAGPGGYGPGTERAAISSGIIAARGVDVVTLSEVQDDQLAVLNNRLAGYSIWPQQSLGNNGQRLQIAWRSSQFEMVTGGSVTFTFASQAIPMPYVLLRDLGTGAEFWVISIHTSAGNLEGERDSGTAIAISLMQRLMAESGKPVIIGGDVNEHEEFFYRVCGAVGFLAANGGGPGCALPPRPLRVDWIMGGGGGGVSFSGYVQDGSTLARASDHYFIHANVSVVDPGDQP